MRHSLRAAIVMAVLGNASAESWTETYVGPGFQIVYSLTCTDVGDCTIRATGNFVGALENPIVTTDVSGHLYRGEGYGGTVIRRVRPTSDGGRVAAGSVNTGDPEQIDAYVVKTDAEGDTTWIAQVNLGGMDTALEIIQTSDNGYVIGGAGAGYMGERAICFVPPTTTCSGTGPSMGSSSGGHVEGVCFVCTACSSSR